MGISLRAISVTPRHILQLKHNIVLLFRAKKLKSHSARGANIDTLKPG